MMKKLPLGDVRKLWQPGPVLLVTAWRGRVRIMIMPARTIVPTSPPHFACSIDPADRGFRALRARCDCVIAIPPTTPKRRNAAIRHRSGRDLVCLTKRWLTVKRATEVAVPLLPECFVNLECRVTSQGYPGHPNIFFLKVVKAWCDPGRKRRRAIRHQGEGRLVVDGDHLRLPSRMP